MKVLIQNPQTFEYLDLDARWTSDPDLAIDFQFALQAITYGVNELKQPFLILFKFDEQSWDFISDAFSREVPRPSRCHQIADLDWPMEPMGVPAGVEECEELSLSVPAE